MLKRIAIFFSLLIAMAAMLVLFTVDERELAIVVQLGKIVRADYQPGIHVKAPYPIQKVKKFDRRIQNLDADPMRFLTSEKKNVMVDFFVKWRIRDVALFYTATSGSGNNMRTASNRLTTIVQKRLRDEFGKRTVVEVVSGERTEIMNALTASTLHKVLAPKAEMDGEKGADGSIIALAPQDIPESVREVLSAKDQAAIDLGIEIVDVRLKRIDWPEDVSGSVFDRMAAERTKVAKDFRSRGQEAAKTIRAKANRDREVILAEANRDAERIRGAGDAKATEVYAAAYGRNQEFYTLYRSLNAYRDTLNDRSDILIMAPDTEFFKYFKEAYGRR